MDRKRLFIMALALVLLTNAVVIGKVLWNRSEVTQSVTLTDRELTKPWRSRTKENSATILTLKWKVVSPKEDHEVYYYNRSLSVDAEVIQDLGFDEKCKRGYTDEERPAWLLMELAGDTWKGQIQKAKDKLESLKQKQDENDDYTISRYERVIHEDTRLFIIDVAASKDALLESIDSNNQFVISGRVSLHYGCDDHMLEIVAVDNPSFYVHDHLMAEEGLPDKFIANIAYGKLGEPWVERIAPAPGTP